MDRRDFIKTTSVVAGAYAIAEPSLLANLRSQGDESWFNRPIRWAAKDDIPLAVECAGMFDCNIYHQPGRLILHMVNLTSTGTWRQPVDEFIPVGPVKVRIKMPEDIRGRSLQLLVSDQKMSTAMEKGWIHFTINSISDHEVAVII